MGMTRYVSVHNFSGQIRLCSPEAAAALVQSGDKIAISANANTPRAFLDALFARAEQLEQVEIMHMRLVGAFPRPHGSWRAISASTHCSSRKPCGRG